MLRSDIRRCKGATDAPGTHMFHTLAASMAEGPWVTVRNIARQMPATKCQTPVLNSSQQKGKQMFSGVALTIRQANGVYFRPVFECHTEDKLTEIISETYRLCREQGAALVNWTVA